MNSNCNLSGGGFFIKTFKASTAAKVLRRMINNGCYVGVVGSSSVERVSYIDVMLAAIKHIGEGNEYASISIATKRDNGYKVEGTVQLWVHKTGAKATVDDQPAETECSISRSANTNHVSTDDRLQSSRSNLL